jgi:hypothetical protein
VFVRYLTVPRPDFDFEIVRIPVSVIFAKRESKSMSKSEKLQFQIPGNGVSLVTHRVQPDFFLANLAKSRQKSEQRKNKGQRRCAEQDILKEN